MKRTITRISEQAQRIIDKVERKDTLTEEEENFLMTPAETAALLTVVKRQQTLDAKAEVSVKYLSVLMQVGRLTPDSDGGANSYRYRVRVVLKTVFNPRGNPNLRKPKLA